MTLFIIVVIAVGISLLVKHRDVKYRKDKIMEELEKKECNHTYKEENSIPEDASLLYCTNMLVKQMFIEGKWHLFLWKDNNILNFCGASEIDCIRKMAIPIEDIQFYTRNGDCRIETVTEGGGVSVGKAIIGGIVGAIVGNIIGDFIDAINFRIFSSGLSSVLAIVLFVLGALLTGRRKVTTINKEIDDRKTYLNYLENNENKRMIFISSDYDELLKLIPEKEASYIENQKNVYAHKSQNDTGNIYKDIEKLAELRDKGILTEDEFNNKKQLLLDKIQ